MSKIKFALASFVTFFALSANAELEGFLQVSKGLYRGGRPMVTADYETLKSLGVRTIISLRTRADGEDLLARQHGLRFVLFPMRAWDYPNDVMVNEILELLRNKDVGPIYLHCYRGKERTGLIVALHRVLHEGWTPVRAYDEWVAAGLNRLFIQFQYYFYRKIRDVQAQERRMRIPAADLAAAGSWGYSLGN